MNDIVEFKEIGGEDVYFYGEVTSTMDKARDLLANGPAAGIVVARSQSMGRGRYGKEWSSREGGLYFSYILDGTLEKTTLLSESVSLAIVKTLECFGVYCKIKFFNDIITVGKKIAGVLVERIGEIYIIGVGINVNNSLEGFPDRTSVKELTKRDIDTEDVLEEFIKQFKVCRHISCSDESKCRRMWSENLLK